LLASLLLLQACVTVDEQYSKNEKASKINVELGIGYLQQNNLDLASEKLLKALRQDPNSAPAHNAYAILQDRLKQLDLAEYHYKKAVSLDSRDSQSSNNYGAFLCRNGREAESEEYFMNALKNPLYKTPEYAYTNAALCLNKINQKSVAKEYLKKALAVKSDFGVALIALAEIYFEEGQYDKAKLYLDRYQLVARPTPRSLWLAIRNELEINGEADVGELAQRLRTDFPDSDEYQSWLKIQ
jgi:type IV pilus assembly protein PilF